ncbi:MAG: response regulator [Candidatus Sericytochromatia bacterium]
MINLLIVEDNEKLRPALKSGLESTKEIKVVEDCESGEKAFEICLESSENTDKSIDAIIMDVQLAGKINGIESAIQIRREFPRIPIIFYSIQDDENYYRDFCNSGILSHYAYVKKSNYLLPQMLLPLIKDAIKGMGFIDPEIESRVHEVRHKDKNSPRTLLEPNELEVIKLISQGMTNEQIASRFGFRDKRTISRINGQIYTTWGLNENATDEKVARTRATLIYIFDRIIQWNEDGIAYIFDENNKKVIWQIK